MQKSQTVPGSNPGQFDWFFVYSFMGWRIICCLAPSASSDCSVLSWLFSVTQLVIKMPTVRTILQLSQTKQVKTIILSASEDLKCVNLFCEKVGGPCVCRIERVLARDDLKNTVESVDLSVNKLTQLPPSLFKLRNMKILNLRNNDLTNLMTEDFSTLVGLESIDLTDNPLSNPLLIINDLRKVLPSTKIIYHVEWCRLFDENFLIQERINSTENVLEIMNPVELK